MRPRPLVAIATVSTLLIPANVAVAAGLNTTITAGPNGAVASRTVTFRFKASVGGATFQCKLDGRSWSACDSPKKYSKLSQGSHTFGVRAKRDGVVDPTPALRKFTVDTVAPKTTILTGPSGESNDPSPSFTFSSNEPGSFRCRLVGSKFKKCKSPFTPADPLEDGTYKFAVRARDPAGNLDPTPATRSFSVERVLTADLETAQAAAELYFPDELVMDVQPVCAEFDSDTDIDCPNGAPRIPSDQLSITSSRDVTAGGPDSYEVAVESGIETLKVIAVSPRETVDCALGITSAYGDAATWTVSLTLQFETDPVSGEPRITSSGVTVGGVEPADWGVARWDESSPDPNSCGRFGFFTSDYVAEVYGLILDGYIATQGAPLCAVEGPGYLGPCT